MDKTLENNVELLAPAGSFASFIAAVNAGADAVYMGINKYNARTMAQNLEISEYIKAIDYAHKRNVKVYLTLNTLLLDSEIEDALNTVLTLYKEGLDAVIIQDIGMASLIHKVVPDLPLHASTQMSVYSLEQVKLLENIGFTRVVLARELSIDEIKYICKNTKLEIEVFVHGALCVSVSGQCLMSAQIGVRSANRGSCAGPCRKQYSLYNTASKTPLVKDKYLISKKDIFGLEHLKKLQQAGVKSFKIEGRNKTIEYTAGVVKNYRKAIDNGYVEEQGAQKEVLQLFNRSGKSYGYLNGVSYRKSISENTPKNTGVILGKVLDVKKQYIKIKLEEKINMHDGIEIVNDKGTTSTIITCIKDENHKILNKEVKEKTIVYLGDVKGKVNIGDIVYKTSNNELNIYYTSYSKGNLRKVQENIFVTIKLNKNITAKVGSISVEVDYMPQLAQNVAIDEKRVKDVFSKTEEDAVAFNTSVEMDSNVFVPISKLNELRRNLVQALEIKRLIKRNIINESGKVKEALKVISSENKYIPLNSLYIYRYNKDTDYIKTYEKKYERKLDIMYITAMDFRTNFKDILKYITRCKVYFVIPNVTMQNTKNYIIENIEEIIKAGISGVLVGNLGYIDNLKDLKSKYNIEIVGDYSLNVTNRYSAKFMKDLGMDRITPLFETDELDIKLISKIMPVEIVQDLVCAMTTRYCVISSFAKNVDSKEKCMVSCKKQNYYLVDTFNKKYEIVTDEADCISRYIRNKKRYTGENISNIDTRNCVLD